MGRLDISEHGREGLLGIHEISMLEGMPKDYRLRLTAVALAMEAGHYSRKAIQDYVKSRFELEIDGETLARIRRNPTFRQVLAELTFRFNAEVRLMTSQLVWTVVKRLLEQVKDDPDCLTKKDVLTLARIVASQSGEEYKKLVEFVTRIEGSGQDVTRASEVKIEELMAR